MLELRVQIFHLRYDVGDVSHGRWRRKPRIRTVLLPAWLAGDLHRHHVLVVALECHWPSKSVVLNLRQEWWNWRLVGVGTHHLLKQLVGVQDVQFIEVEHRDSEVRTDGTFGLLGYLLKLCEVQSLIFLRNSAQHLSARDVDKLISKCAFNVRICGPVVYFFYVNKAVEVLRALSRRESEVKDEVAVLTLCFWEIWYNYVILFVFFRQRLKSSQNV